MMPPAPATNGRVSGDDFGGELHCWRFTPASFRLVVDDLADLGLTTLGVVAEHDTVGCEFFTTLGRAQHRVRQGGSPGSRRLGSPTRALARPRTEADCHRASCACTCPCGSNGPGAARPGGRESDEGASHRGVPFARTARVGRGKGAAAMDRRSLSARPARWRCGAHRHPRCHPAGNHPCRCAGIGRAIRPDPAQRTTSVHRGGLSDECQSGRTKFHTWLDASHTADTAASHAHNQWADQHAENGLSAREALTTAVDAYNADLQVAQALQAKADKKLTKLNKARGGELASSMPKGCQREYTQYDAVIENVTRGAASNVAVEQAIAAEQDALQRGSRTDYNNAVRDQNAAVAQSNDIGNDYNITVLPALNSAIAACNRG